MEKRKILNKILAIFCLLTIGMPSFTQVLMAVEDTANATGDTAKFGISFLNKNGWGYKIQNRLTYRVYEAKGSTKDYSRDIYCLDYTKKFPAEDSNKDTFTIKGN